MNVFDLLNIYMDKIKKDHPNDISIIIYTGSYLTGNIHEKSDLDVIFIPNTEKGFGLGLCFIYNDIGFDFYPRSWEWIKYLGEYKSPDSTILLNSKVVYYRNKDDLKKFEYYKNKVKEINQNELSTQIIANAMQLLVECYFFLNNIKIITDNSKSITSGQIEAFKIISRVIDAFCIINKIILKTHWSKNIKIFDSFTLLPGNFRENIMEIITEKEVNRLYVIAQEFLNSSYNYLKELKNKKEQKISVKEMFNAFYEENKIAINRILQACETENYFLAYYTIQIMQFDTSLFLSYVYRHSGYSVYNTYDEYKDYYISYGLPDLIKILNERDFKRLASETKIFEEKMFKFISGNNIKINSMNSMEEYRNYIEKTL